MENGAHVVVDAGDHCEQSYNLRGKDREIQQRPRVLLYRLLVFCCLGFRFTALVFRLSGIFGD